MASKKSNPIASAILCLMTTAILIGTVLGGNMNQEMSLSWGGPRAKITGSDGNLLTLTLDRISGSGFQSKNKYMFGKIDIQMKLVPGNSAGTVTAYYLSSEVPSNRDEIDMEFLGNLTGDPYTLHTNIYTRGKGAREQQFRLWFDPTRDFHTYSILWTPAVIVISVDGTPIREFKNMENRGVPFPKAQPMRLYSSIWNADQWATRGGLVKTDWAQAPFLASYRNFVARACVWPARRACAFGGGSGRAGWLSQKLDPVRAQRLRWVQRNFMIYNYCTDVKRFPRGFPPECRLM
ncbi:hypothetical protein V2J09_010250 [Rumex salicifolius]